MVKIPTKKLKNGFEMPIYGLGTWQMGGKTTHNPENDDNADIEAIKQAIASGVTHIDTAEKYADGYAEILLGKAIRHTERQNLFLVSKVANYHLKYDDLINAAKNSLKRIQTNYLDLYLIHSPNPNISIKETMNAMDTLVEEGLIKNIGISNFNVEETQEAQAHTKYGIKATQMHLNLKYRESEKRGVLKYCQENDIMFIAWRPLQKGLLFEGKSSLLENIAQKYSKTPSQIALNWLISQKNIVTLSKTSDSKHLKENIEATTWQMDPEDIKKLTNDFPNQEYISDAVPLN